MPGPVTTSCGGLAPSREESDSAVLLVVDRPKLTRPLHETADVTSTLVHVPVVTLPELPSLPPKGGAFEAVLEVRADRQVILRKRGGGPGIEPQERTAERASLGEGDLVGLAAAVEQQVSRGGMGGRGGGGEGGGQCGQAEPAAPETWRREGRRIHNVRASRV